RPDLRRLLPGVAVGRDRADERHAVLLCRGLLERDVRAPEIGAVAGERDADLDGRPMLRVPAGGERGEHAGEPDQRERAENATLHRLLLLRTVESLTVVTRGLPLSTSRARPGRRTRTGTRDGSRCCSPAPSARGSGPARRGPGRRSARAGGRRTRR